MCTRISPQPLQAVTLPVTDVVVFYGFETKKLSCSCLRFDKMGAFFRSCSPFFSPGEFWKGTEEGRVFWKGLPDPKIHLLLDDFWVEKTSPKRYRFFHQNGLSSHIPTTNSRLPKEKDTEVIGTTSTRTTTQTGASWVLSGGWLGNWKSEAAERPGSSRLAEEAKNNRLHQVFVANIFFWRGRSPPPFLFLEGGFSLVCQDIRCYFGVSLGSGWGFFPTKKTPSSGGTRFFRQDGPPKKKPRWEQEASPESTRPDTMGGGSFFTWGNYTMPVDLPQTLSEVCFWGWEYRLLWCHLETTLPSNPTKNFQRYFHVESF